MPFVPSSHSSTGRLSFSQPADTQSVREQYLSEWMEWAENCAPGENRALAFSRLKLCLENNESHLDLSTLNLTSLPSLPEHVRSLKIDHNALTSLPRLPDSLEKIEASFNQLTTLPELPESLKVLRVGGNRLSTLPELPSALEDISVRRNRITMLPVLPSSLQVLSAGMNRLSILPELPSSLKEIHVYYNHLSELPELPASLKNLNISNNRLSALPELPVSLESLNACHNHISALPGLPESLEYLNVHDNHLTTLPPLPSVLEFVDANRNRLESLPDFPAEHRSGMRVYWLSHNQLTTVPETILGLSPVSTVIITDNPLSSRARQMLLRQTTGLNYHGPRILFSMSDGQQHTPVRPLPEAVAAWFPEALQSQVSQTWIAFTEEENALTFSAFLDRLADTVTARNAPGFRQRVGSFLEKLSTSAELRQQCLAVAADATRSCEDRVALTWNNLQKTFRVHQASEGDFDSDLSRLLSLGREMFRLNVLEDIAREKVRTLHFVDEIEVYLAFQTMLAEKLQLSTAVREMRFYGVSGVTENDLSRAVELVSSRESAEFTDWFARWEPWHAVLKRTEAERWAQAREKRYDMLEEDYPRRVAEQLSASGLSGDADAEREAGVQVMQEIETQIYRQLTEEVLALRLPENSAHLHD
ncbi:TPA: E3 ubiquitin--protein ligase [Escherichia coli]|nr:E3 ubiquitin--protein ligase [Escherichia coli]